MRLCRFNEGRVGIVEEAQVRDVTAALDVLPTYRYPMPPFDTLIAGLAQVLDRAQALGQTARVPLAGVRLLSPVANPSKIVAAPVNYQKHLDEVRGDAQLHHGNEIAAGQRAGLFLKASSSLVGASQGIAVSHPDRRTDHEVELAVVIGKTARNVDRDDALEHVAGYGVGLDITVRGPEERSLRKSIDSYTVLGPWLVTADEIPDPGGLDLQIAVNGTIRQKSNTRDLIRGVPELIEFASSFYTLHPGDIIFTGTPEGVGPIAPGDVLLASVERIGAMEVHVRAA